MTFRPFRDFKEGDVVRCTHQDHLGRIGVVVTSPYQTPWATTNVQVRYKEEQRNVCIDFLQKVALE